MRAPYSGRTRSKKSLPARLPNALAACEKVPCRSSSDRWPGSGTPAVSRSAGESPVDAATRNQPSSIFDFAQRRFSTTAASSGIATLTALVDGRLRHLHDDDLDRLRYHTATSHTRPRSAGLGCGTARRRFPRRGVCPAPPVRCSGERSVRPMDGGSR